MTPEEEEFITFITGPMCAMFWLRDENGAKTVLGDGWEKAQAEVDRLLACQDGKSFFYSKLYL